MKKSVLLICSVVCLQGFGQQWQWATKATTSTGAQKAIKICNDISGNVIAIGCNIAKATYGSTVLDSGCFIVKYNNNGVIQWARSLGGEAKDINCDASGNIYLAGNFTGNLTIGSSTFNSGNQKDIFVVKFTATGLLSWAKTFGGSNDDEVCALAVDNNSNCYITGLFRSNCTFGTLTLQDSTHFGSMFLAKLNSVGNIQWAGSETANISKYEISFWRGTCVRVCKSQDVYVAGFGSEYGSPYHGYFLLKYDASGNMMLRKDNLRYFPGNDIAIDNEANVFHIYNSSTHYYYTPELVKYNSTIDQTWQKSVCDGGYYSIYAMDKGLCSDDSGNVYISGSLGTDNMTGNVQQVCDYQMTRTGGSDVIVGKYDKNGKCAWFKTAGGMNNERAEAMCSDAQGNCYVMGIYNSQGKPANSDMVAFDTNTLTNDGNWGQLFIAKLSTTVNYTDVNILADANNKINVYPNPSSGMFNVVLTDKTNVCIYVYDVLGKRILKKECRNESNQQIDLSYQPKGIYFIEVLAGADKQVKKVSVE